MPPAHGAPYTGGQVSGDPYQHFVGETPSEQTTRERPWANDPSIVDHLMADEIEAETGVEHLDGHEIKPFAVEVGGEYKARCGVTISISEYDFVRDRYIGSWRGTAGGTC